MRSIADYQMTIDQRISSLDTSLFSQIESQTSDADRRSLLALQDAVRQRHQRYTYLEIGSHLGGSLQPYLLDGRCTRIYSIDPRPTMQPDDRQPGHVAHYEDNSTQRMLDNLSRVSAEGIAKIKCFESDASVIDPDAIASPVQLAFIDGEHTSRAVLSDFAFCLRVLAPNGTIAFHDTQIIYRAISEIRRILNRDHRRFEEHKLEGSVLAMTFDCGLTAAGNPLSRISESSLKRWRRFVRRQRIRACLPRPLVHAFDAMRSP